MAYKIFGIFGYIWKCLAEGEEESDIIRYLYNPNCNQ